MMRAAVLIACGILAGAVLLADSTSTDTVAIDTLEVRVDSLHIQQKAMKGRLLAILEHITKRADELKIDSTGTEVETAADTLLAQKECKNGQ